MITKIHIRNLKGLTGSFELGKVTNLYGPNGSGKSAILEALKIGLTGYTDLGKLAGKTMQLSSGKVMEITLESEDGQTLSRKFEKSGPGAKQSIAVNGEPVKDSELVVPASLSYPVEAIHPGEFLALSGDKRADFIFSSLGSGINTITPDDLPDTPCLEKPLAFGDLLKALKDKQAETEKEIKRCVANIQKLTGELETLPAGSLAEWQERRAKDQADLEKLVADLARNEERANLAKSKNDQRQRLEKAILDADNHVKSSTERIKILESQIRTSRDADPAATAEKTHRDAEALKLKQQALQIEARELKKRIEIFEKGKCPLCSASASDLGDKLDEWELQGFNLETALISATKDLEQALKALAIADDESKILKTNTESNREIQIEINAIQNYKKFRAEQSAALDSLNADAAENPVNAEVLKGQLEGLRSRITEADQAIKSFHGVQAVRNKKSEACEEMNSLEGMKDRIKQALEDAKTVRDSRLDEASASLLEPFQTIVKSAFNSPAFLRLSKSDKPCFDFGIIRDRQEIEFDTLSGGEKTILLSALVACIQIVKTGRVGLGLFELAEADETRVKELIGAAEKIGFDQIVIASCHGGIIPNATNWDMGVRTA